METLQQPLPAADASIDLWDGNAAARILDVIAEKFPG
jgi:hypothetical protein